MDDATAKTKPKPEEPTMTPEEMEKEKKAKADKMHDEQQKTMTTKGAIKDKEMAEALRIAQEAEKLEEEELMRKAIEESQKFE